MDSNLRYSNMEWTAVILHDDVTDNAIIGVSSVLINFVCSVSVLRSIIYLSFEAANHCRGRVTLRLPHWRYALSHSRNSLFVECARYIRYITWSSFGHGKIYSSFLVFVFWYEILMIQSVFIRYLLCPVNTPSGPSTLHIGLWWNPSSSANCDYNTWYR